MGASKVGRLGNTLRTWLQRPEALKPRPLQLLQPAGKGRVVVHCHVDLPSVSLPAGGQSGEDIPEAVLLEDDLKLPAACFAKPIMVDDVAYMPGVYGPVPNKDWAEEMYQDHGGEG